MAAARETPEGDVTAEEIREILIRYAGDAKPDPSDYLVRYSTFIAVGEADRADSADFARRKQIVEKWVISADHPAMAIVLMFDELKREKISDEYGEVEHLAPIWWDETEADKRPATHRDPESILEAARYVANYRDVADDDDDLGDIYGHRLVRLNGRVRHLSSPSPLVKAARVTP